MAGTGKRSPSAPSQSLESCLTFAVKLYDAYAHSSFSAVDFASLIDRSAASGAFRCLLSDMKQYGLLEKRESGSFEVSQRVKDYCSLENPDAKRAARFDFAIQPPFFETLIGGLRDRLPEERALANSLMSQHGFNKAKARTTARAFCESLAFADAVDAKRNIVRPKSTEASYRAESLESSEAVEESPSRPAVYGGDLFVHSFEHDSAQSQLLGMEIPLKNGRIVRIQYPNDLASFEAEKVGTILNALCVLSEE